METSVKYTTILPKDCLEELKQLADMKVISSVSQGIRMAVEEFVAIRKKLAYENAMREAAEDEAFMGRTMDAQHDFIFADAEVEKW
jgi:metal-responsive CopG/Arc/MetJ family transcriptional regulator